MNRKHLRTRILPLAAAALMVLGLTACRDLDGGLSTDDAKECVQVELDTTYKGDFAGFVDFYSNVTTQDARDQHDAQLEWEIYNFINTFGVSSWEDDYAAAELSELQMHRAKQLYDDVYAKCDYTVVSSNKQEDGTFAVKVTIKPMNINTLVNNAYEDGFAAFDEKFEAIMDEVRAMSAEEQAEWYTNTYVSEYYDTLLDILEDQIPDIGYLDERSIVIQVQQSEDDSLFISDDDLLNLDKLIIDYSLS